jgi:hypothetical protein
MDVYLLSDRCKENEVRDNGGLTEEPLKTKRASRLFAGTP